MILALLAVSSVQQAHAFTTNSRSSQCHRLQPSSSICMVMSLPDKDTSTWSSGKEMSLDQFHKKRNQKNKVRKKYKRKRMPETEKEHLKFKRERQAEYEQIMSNAKGEASIFSFEQLFPQPVWDDETIKRDLFSIKKQDTQTTLRHLQNQQKSMRSKMKTSAIGGSSMMRVWREPKLSSYILPYDPPPTETSYDEQPQQAESIQIQEEKVDEKELARNVLESVSTDETQSLSERLAAAAVNTTATKAGKVNYEMTRRVEDKIYGYRRGTNTYDTSLMGDGAIKFREGIRLGNPLSINAARLNYFAKKELRKDRVEEARDLYEQAIEIDPRDGRAYLGLSKCAEKRRDFKLARECLLAGIQNAVSIDSRDIPDRGANPFLLQALGVLEEKKGNLAEAEALYIEAAKSRPSHAAAWVALAQIRTRKFRQSAAAGRVCYQRAEQELRKAGLPPSAHVYTAWASLEYKKAGDVRRARELFKLALTADPKCSAAWLQLGVMEANNENWEKAEQCFETVLKFDQRNSRVLQAYAIMESKRPEADSRKAIGLFERALTVNPRDAGVLQPYALYVAELGDIDMARKL
jgi:tetratricopeptide (TPR) repeat protein